MPVGRGLVDIPRTPRVLRDARFDGLLAIEIDDLRMIFDADEDAALTESIASTRHVLATVTGEDPAGTATRS